MFAATEMEMKERLWTEGSIEEFAAEMPQPEPT
jgi:hypothetical protein